MFRIFQVLLVLTGAFALASCSSPSDTVTEPILEEKVEVPVEPERIATRPGESTNVCIDELSDSGFGTYTGFDIDTVAISKNDGSFIYSFKTERPVSTSRNVSATISIYPVGSRTGGVSLDTFIAKDKYTVNAWTADGFNNYIESESEVSWNGTELVTTIPLHYLESAGVGENFEWSAFIAYNGNEKDSCPSGEFGSMIFSAF